MALLAAIAICDISGGAVMRLEQLRPDQRLLMRFLQSFLLAHGSHPRDRLALNEDLGQRKLAGRAEEARQMVIQIVEFTSGLSDEEVRRMIEVRAPQYRQVAGLFQKFYVRNSGSGRRYAGIYIWADEDSLREAHDSDLERSIRDVFRVDGLVHVKTFEVMSVLHP